MPEVLSRNNVLVSVIIPCYNGAALIMDTLNSVFSQESIRFEIIFVDDGSKDDTKPKVLSFNDARLHYFYQPNAGVSAARNNGLNLAKGDYVVFFDADDKMTAGFLKTRLEFLLNNQLTDFICGQVQNFTGDTIGTEIFRGAGNLDEILLYSRRITTCPSNYMFKKSFLKTHKLEFNTSLSSTADRFFLIQCMLKGHSCFNASIGKLLYRISPNSMSNHLTQTLVKDNENYYNLLRENNLIPVLLRKESLFLGNMILYKSYWKVGLKSRSLQFGLKALLSNPISFFKKLY